MLGRSKSERAVSPVTVTFRGVPRIFKQASLLAQDDAAQLILFVADLARSLDAGALILDPPREF